MAIDMKTPREFFYRVDRHRVSIAANLGRCGVTGFFVCCSPA
jgi:hypothetical protein